MFLGVAVLGLEYVVLKVGQSVGLEMGEEYYVVFVLKGITEAQHVEGDVHSVIVFKFVRGDHLFVPKVVGLKLLVDELTADSRSLVLSLLRQYSMSKHPLCHSLVPLSLFCLVE